MTDRTPEQTTNAIKLRLQPIVERLQSLNDEGINTAMRKLIGSLLNETGCGLTGVQEMFTNKEADPIEPVNTFEDSANEITTTEGFKGDDNTVARGRGNIMHKLKT